MDAPPNVIDTEPTAPSDQPPAPPDSVEDAPDRVLLGVAGFLADHLGLDALWVRLAFVVLALTGGIGIVIYLASWLVLFGPERTGIHWLRYAGGVIAVIGVPMMIAGGNLEFLDGPPAVVALLIGLTLALWQPRRDPAPRRPATRPLPPPSAPAAASSFSESIPAPEPEPRPSRPRRPRREPSMLGRATLGLAVIVAAIGALIDQFNGGRLHPEQWLGAAALVCGVGLLVGVVRGRAWWLIVPALLFAGLGYVSGVMSRLGIDAADAVGDQSLYVSDATPGGSATLQTGVGSISITVDGAPTDPLTIDARSAFGTIQLGAVDDVSIEIRSASERGDLIVDGVVAAGGVTRIGPDRRPDVIVDARQGIGDVVVWTYEVDRTDRAVPPDLPAIDPLVPPDPSVTTPPPTPTIVSPPTPTIVSPPTPTIVSPPTPTIPAVPTTDPIGD